MTPKRNLLLVLVALSGPPVAARAEPPTFTEDVAPILERRCVECHRPGEVAPMSLRSWEEARPWARSIRRAVAAREMPPWSADPAIGSFRNDRRLSDDEVDTLVRWVDAGAPRGPERPEEAAAAPSAADGWTIGEPDLVVAMPEPFEVPAGGLVDYVYLRLPTGTTEDRWIRAIEVRPGAREVIHHIDVTACEAGCPGSSFLSSLEPGVATTRPDDDEPDEPGEPEEPTMPEPTSVAWVEGETRGFLTSFLPGGRPTMLPEGYAHLLPAGADIVLNIHYQPNGVPTADRSEVGFVFAERPKQRVISYFLDNYSIWIPAGEARYEVDSRATLARDVELLALTPHMHSRGIAAEVALATPRGDAEPLLRVPRYDFNWQITYELSEPRRLDAGSQLSYRLVWDNSADNLANPDPSRDVPWGQQTRDEMASVFVTVAVPPTVEPREVFVER